MAHDLTRMFFNPRVAPTSPPVDLITGVWLSVPFTGNTGRVLTVVTSVVDERPLAVSGCDDLTVWVWDQTTRQPFHHSVVSGFGRG